MKVHIADGVSTGDNFVHPLGEIREVLERYCKLYSCHMYMHVFVLSLVRNYIAFLVQLQKRAQNLLSSVAGGMCIV